MSYLFFANTQTRTSLVFPMCINYLKAMELVQILPSKSQACFNGQSFMGSSAYSKQ